LNIFRSRFGKDSESIRNAYFSGSLPDEGIPASELAGDNVDGAGGSGAVAAPLITGADAGLGGGLNAEQDRRVATAGTIPGKPENPDKPKEKKAEKKETGPLGPGVGLLKKCRITY
jgi:hypothetical protein